MNPKNKMTLSQKIAKIKSGKLSAVENLLDFSKKIATPKTKDLNIFLHLNEDAIEQAKALDKKIKQGKPTGKLSGLCFAVKSNICVKGLTTNCASKVLEDFVAPYNATAINNLLAEDAICLGMLNMDEFAAGASGETSAFGPTKNPTNPKLIPGGSSSGPAAAVATELCDFSLGSDTGGSIRNPASHCGVTGLKPTYGAVSRYGLIDLSMSLDVIGPLTKTPEDAKLIFGVIKGHDYFDTTTVEYPSSLSSTGVLDLTDKRDKIEQSKGDTISTNSKAFGANNKRSKASPDTKGGRETKSRELGRKSTTPRSKTKTLTIGLVNTKGFCDEKISKLIKTKTEHAAKKHKWKVKEIHLPLDIAIETYYILVYTEFFSATRKFDGRRFGKKIEDTAGPEVQRRIIGGSEITKAEHEGRFYNEALKARNYIKEQFKKLFEDVDAIILPTVPRTPHKIGEDISVEDMYNYDVLTTPASIAGLPAISVPVGKVDGKAVGLQVITDMFEEELLFDVCKEF